jgi:hypothetical protein
MYFDSEKHGLEFVGELEFSDGNYQFDTTAVWVDSKTKRLYWADDSGCSCPAPFENLGSREDLITGGGLTALNRHLQKRRDDSYYNYVNASDIQDLMAKAREAVGK